MGGERQEKITMSIDCEVSLKSLLFVAESLEELLGVHGAQAVMRSAGRRAAISLIEMLPLKLDEETAILRAGNILIELGFVSGLEIIATGKLQIHENQVPKELKQLGLAKIEAGRYYVIGLFEGFFRQLSGSARKITGVETDKFNEYWILT